MKPKLKVVKIGGKMIDDETKLNRILDAFAKIDDQKIFVHGGASQADDLLKNLGIEKVKIDGRRITDKATLDVCVMVYAGLLNKQLVADLSKRDVSALGMCGADLNSIECIKRPIEKVDYGFVGDYKAINDKAIKGLLDQGIALVYSAITHDNQGQLLNTNGDTIATMLAVSLSKYFEVELLYIFDRPGVVRFQDGEEQVISEINPSKFESMMSSGEIKDGLIPKLQNGFDALRNGIQSIRMGGAEVMTDMTSGTKVVSS